MFSCFKCSIDLANLIILFVRTICLIFLLPTALYHVAKGTLFTIADPSPIIVPAGLKGTPNTSFVLISLSNSSMRQNLKFALTVFLAKKLSQRSI